MTATPDTTARIDEESSLVADAIYDALLEHGASSGDVTAALEPVLATIRRHAAADALREQARRFRKSVVDHPKLAEGQATHGTGAWNAARVLNAAADAIIAEGYEHTCAAQTWATRSDPGYGCETPVPEAGDYCPKHEPEDDEDRWAE